MPGRRLSPNEALSRNLKSFHRYEVRDSMRSVIVATSANSIPWCSVLGAFTVPSGCPVGLFSDSSSSFSRVWKYARSQRNASKNAARADLEGRALLCAVLRDVRPTGQLGERGRLETAAQIGEQIDLRRPFVAQAELRRDLLVARVEAVVAVGEEAVFELARRACRLRADHRDPLRMEVVLVLEVQREVRSPSGRFPRWERLARRRRSGSGCRRCSRRATGVRRRSGSCAPRAPTRRYSAAPRRSRSKPGRAPGRSGGTGPCTSRTRSPPASPHRGGASSCSRSGTAGSRASGGPRRCRRSPAAGPPRAAPSSTFRAVANRCRARRSRCASRAQASMRSPTFANRRVLSCFDHSRNPSCPECASEPE